MGMLSGQLPLHIHPSISFIVLGHVRERLSTLSARQTPNGKPALHRRLSRRNMSRHAGSVPPCASCVRPMYSANARANTMGSRQRGAALHCNWGIQACCLLFLFYYIYFIFYFIFLQFIINFHLILCPYTYIVTLLLLQVVSLISCHQLP